MSSWIKICLALAFLIPISRSSAQEAAKSPAELTEPPGDPPGNPPIEAKSPKKLPDDGAFAEAAKARIFAVERLRALSLPAEKGNPRDKAGEARIAILREIFKTRERLILDWEKTIKAYQAVLNPQPSPEAEADELKISLERLKVGLAKAKKDSSSLLPDNLRETPAVLTDAVLNEVKEAVGDAEEAVQNFSKDLEALTAVPNRKNATPVAAAKAERDETRKRIAALGPRTTEAETALAAATSAEDREIVRERLGNLDWETKVELESLKEVEARISLEMRRTAVAEVKVQVLTIKLELAKMTFDLVRSRFAALGDRQKTELKKASAAEADRANQTNDPLEKYRAHRKQELLEQQELLREKEQVQAASPLVSFDDQKAKANKAEQDFEKLKKLVEGGRSSTLVAQRLNNSYRRLSTERASISRDELLKITALLGKYENELTAIELDLLNDERGDGSLRENLLASLPKSRESEANAVFAETEKALRHVLEERRKILTALEERAEKTREEVLRRLRILEDQHAFVRTHLFWVRDSQPIGTNSVVRVRREGRDLGRTLLSIAAEPWKRSHWERISVEFLLVVLGLLILPYVLYRTRRALRAILVRESETRLAQAL